MPLSQKTVTNRKGSCIYVNMWFQHIWLNEVIHFNLLILCNYCQGPECNVILPCLDIQLFVLKASSDMVHLCRIGSGCCEKFCMGNQIWETLSDIGNSFCSWSCSFCDLCCRCISAWPHTFLNCWLDFIIDLTHYHCALVWCSWLLSEHTFTVLALLSWCHGNMPFGEDAVPVCLTFLLHSWLTIFMVQPTLAAPW